MHFYHFINKQFRFLGPLTYPQNLNLPIFTANIFFYHFINKLFYILDPYLHFYSEYKRI